MPLPAEETTQQRKRREVREVRFLAWLQNAYQTGTRHASRFQDIEDSHRIVSQADAEFAQHHYADAKKRHLLTSGTASTALWVQHYLEGALRVPFDSLKSSHLSVFDVLYPKIGRVQR